MSRADEIIDTLLGAGEVLDEGGFTIDGAHARAKLAHGLADPDSYIVVLARAALLRGATRLEIDPGWVRTRVRFDGRPLREAELSELASFSELDDDQPGDAASRRALTQAVQAAIATPKPGAEAGNTRRRAPRVRISTRADGSRTDVALVGVEIGPDGERPFARTQPPAEWSTVIEVDHPRTFARLVELVVLATPEHRWTRHALVFAAPAQVHLTGHQQPFRGRLVVGPNFGAMSRQVIDLNAVGLDGIASWRYGSEERAPQVIVVVGGVRIVSKPLPGDFTCIDLAAVRDDRLRLDASGFDVVADARWDALMSRLRVADQRYRELPRLRADEGFECESMRYDPTDEQPPAPRPYPTDWPENVAGIAAVFLLGLVVMDLGPWVTGLGLVGFALLLAKILQRLDFLRNCNRGSFAAWLPASRTLAAGLVYGLGVVGCLIRLLLGFAR